MGFTYEIVTDWYVRSVKIGSFLFTKELIAFILKTTGKKVGPLRAASLLDGNNNCLAIRDGKTPRRWKRIA